MGCNKYALAVSPWLMITSSAIPSLLIFAVGLKGQTSIGRAVSISVAQDGQKFQTRIADPLALRGIVSAGAVDGVLAHRKTKNNLAYLRGLRVQVVISDPLAGLTTGSGFWISSAGFVITCWRNLSQSPDGIITIKSAASSGQLMQGRLLAQDIQKNLALIKVLPNPFIGAKLRPSTRNPHLRAAIPAPNLPQIGDKLLVVVAQSGRPDFAVQEQSVAAVRPVVELGGELKILVSGVTRYGRPGEPVVGDSGQVVGILEGPYPSPDRTKWAITEVVIPIQAALELLKATLVGHFKDPPAYTPGSLIPAFKYLTDDQLKALTAFLESQKAQRRQEQY